ncbi:MAG: thermopsin, partial [Sulfolobaceae archaeon]
PSNTLVLTSPLTVKVVYEIQYKVIINGNTSWVFNGSEIRLYSYEPFYYQVSWQGTYNVPNGYVITVNKPIIERAIISINYINVVSALLFVLSPLLMLLAVIRRK